MTVNMMIISGDDHDEYPGVMTVRSGHHRSYSAYSDSLANGSPVYSREEGPVHTPPSDHNAHPVEKTSTQKWSRGADSLAATWAFTLTFHSLLYLPLSIIRHGGLVFLMMYLLMLVFVGGPLVVVEMFLGQYSGLSVTRLYRHLCPAMSGLGVALNIQSAVWAVLDLAMAMWAGRAAVTVFYSQGDGEHVMPVMAVNSTTSHMGDIVTLNSEAVISLGVVSLCSFVLLAAGTRSIGKVCLLTVPVCYGLLITLCIRTCMDPNGPQGFLSLIKPQWSALSQASAWLEAAAHVIFSLRLGVGVISTYGSYSKFHHNIIRDSWVIIIGHIFWVVLSVFLIFSLLGVAYKEELLKSTNLTASSMFFANNERLGLGVITLVESAFADLSYGWLWAGLFFILLIIISVTSIFGYIEVIANSIVSHRATCLRFKPFISFVVLLVLSVICIILSTEAGIPLFHLLHTYIANWPLLLFCVLSVLSCVHSHVTVYIVKDLSSMCRTNISHVMSSHFSVLITTIIPLLLTASLCWVLYSISLVPYVMFLNTHLDPLAWALVATPFVPVIVGTVWYILGGGARGVMWTKHLINIFKSTATWHRNHHLQLLEDRNKEELVS